MDHVAIMKKSWHLTQKILTGEKTIESRWSMTRCAPWGRIKAGEKVYFKDAGEQVKVQAEVSRVLQLFLTPRRVRDILKRYGGRDGIGISDVNERDKFYRRFKGKRYCVLIFLKKPRRIAPFCISKKGFGIMAAWISVPDIDAIKILSR